MSEQNQWSNPNKSSENESGGASWPSGDFASDPSAAGPYAGTQEPAQPTSTYNWEATGQTTAYSSYPDQSESYTDPGQQYGGYGFGQPPTGEPQVQPEAAVSYPATDRTTGNPLIGQSKSFLGDLFDLSFTRWASPAIAKVGYGLTVVVVILVALFLILSAFATGYALPILSALIIVPLTSLLLLSLIRMLFESTIALIRIAENTSAQMNPENL